MTDAYDRGLALLAQIHGGHAGEALVAAQRDVCPGGAAVANALQTVKDVLATRT